MGANDRARHPATSFFGGNGCGTDYRHWNVEMKKHCLAGFLAVVGLSLVGPGFASAVPANAAATTPRYQSRAEAENARAACILPWYRFFGACNEAIDDYPYGNHWHEWNNRRYHRYR